MGYEVSYSRVENQLDFINEMNNLEVRFYIYLYNNLFTLYLGLAWVSGMCHPEYSCTINEGNNFESGIIHILRKHIYRLYEHLFPSYIREHP